jgi:hypothetical protein
LVAVGRSAGFSQSTAATPLAKLWERRWCMVCRASMSLSIPDDLREEEEAAEPWEEAKLEVEEEEGGDLDFDEREKAAVAFVRSSTASSLVGLGLASLASLDPFFM